LNFKQHVHWIVQKVFKNLAGENSIEVRARIRELIPLSIEEIDLTPKDLGAVDGRYLGRHLSHVAVVSGTHIFITKHTFQRRRHLHVCPKL
jgi:hypothetical protein